LFDGEVGLGENLAENFASRVTKGFIGLGVVDGWVFTEDEETTGWVGEGGREVGCGASRCRG
jgi:hypothetical protein